MNIICRVIGHKDTGINDSGYFVCARCNMHEYYDSQVICQNIPDIIRLLIGTILWKVKFLINRILWKFDKSELPF